MDDINQKPSRPRYELQSFVKSDRDDNASFTVRRNGKAFYIDVLPLQFVNSPATTEKYMSYLEVLRSDEDVIGDVYETDAIEWVLEPFEPFFAELAPSPPPGDFKVTLSDYIAPEFFVLVLDIVDEELRPRRREVKRSPYRHTGAWLDDDFLDDLELWTHLYDPAGIVLSFDNPEDALFRPPRKVLIDNGQTACFYKPCYSPLQTKTELNAYRKIAAADLDPQLHICRVVVHDDGCILGLLLSYIGNGIFPCPLMWAPLDAAVMALHGAGIVWGDVKAENVLIDQDNNAWITDFGGGYTEGWADKSVAGTVEGDLAGMAKLREFLLQDEA